MFDNASSHQKRADNALSAQRMIKGAWFTYFLLSSSHSFQPQRTAGSTIQVANACAMACFQLVPCNFFTLQMITLPCPGGLRAWKSSFVSGDCGQNNGHWLHNAWSSTALLVILIAAADGFFSRSLTLRVRSCSFRSSSRAVGTFATSTQSIIVN